MVTLVTDFVVDLFRVELEKRLRMELSEKTS